MQSVVGKGTGRDTHNPVSCARYFRPGKRQLSLIVVSVAGFHVFLKFMASDIRRWGQEDMLSLQK